MRIAMLCQSYPPMISGAALVVQRLARALAQRGHAVLVLCASDRETPYDRLSAGVEEVHLRSHANPFRLKQRYLLWPHKDAVARLERFIPDIIHLHEPFLLALTGLEYAARCAASSVLTVHALPSIASAYTQEVPGAARLVEAGSWAYARWLLRQVQRVVTPTQTVAKLVASQTGLQADIISNGVDLETYSPEKLDADDERRLRQRLGIPPTAPVILHAGRLDKEKQVDVVINAAAWAIRRSQAHLVIAGDGQQRGQLAGLCRRLGIQSRTRFTGYIPEPQHLAQLYKLASVFVTACDVETQGLVLLEAAACGLPLVGVHATSIPEIVLPGENGYLAQPGDADRMGKYLLKIIANPSLAARFGRASHEIASQHAIQQSINRYETLYQDLLEPVKV